VSTFVLIACAAAYVGVLTAVRRLRPGARVAFAGGAGLLLLVMAWTDVQAAYGARLVCTGLVIAAILFTVRTRGRRPDER
jgi:hypothetical protein